MNFIFHATGHPAVLSTHPSTIEITKEAHLTRNGDCIVAVNSTVGPADLPVKLRATISAREAKIRVALSVGQLQFTVEGEGDDRLDLTHPTDFVIRRSGFISDRTLMIHADKAAIDIPREMVRLLRDPMTDVRIQIATSDD